MQVDQHWIAVKVSNIFPPHRYNFFLDEMISIRNDQTVERLRRIGMQPRSRLAQTSY